QDVAAACLFLSGKSEECPRKIDHIVHVVEREVPGHQARPSEVRRRDGPAGDDREHDTANDRLRPASGAAPPAGAESDARHCQKFHKIQEFYFIEGVLLQAVRHLVGHSLLSGCDCGRPRVHSVHVGGVRGSA
ncbi:hypothetical protein PFISCL1PPCAC_13832, partial [Pristionchus fissidentatus]